MNKALFVMSLAAVAVGANAQILYTGGTYSENFDGLPGTTQTAFFSATVGVQTAISGVTGFSGTKNAGTGTVGANLTADDGTNNSGAIRSAFNIGSAERALGFLASGSNSMSMGFELVNNSGAALSSVTISFVREFWRSSTATTNVGTAAWGRTGGGMTSADYLTSASMTAESSLNLVGEAFVAANGALDGNSAAHQVAVSSTITLTTPLAVGDSLFVRWADFNDGGNDALLAIDNMNITSTAVPEPATLAVLGLGAAALIRRRRKS